MVAALIQWQFELDGSGVWNTQTGRVEGEAILREGLAIESLGGPEADGRTSSLQLILNNATGWWTKGAGSGYGPGSRVRMRWRATTGDNWEVRFVGTLAESYPEHRGYSRIRSRWLGPLWKLKSGRIPARTVIDRTAPEIMGELCQAAGIPVADWNFDADATDYGFTLAAGYPGVTAFLSGVNGRVWDDEQGRVRLELQATRDAATVQQTYRETGAGGIQIAPPRSLTKPFGIVNEVPLEVHVYTPEGLVIGQTVMVDVPFAVFRTYVPDSLNPPMMYTVSITLDNPLQGAVTVTDYDILFEIFAFSYDTFATVNGTLSHPDTGITVATTFGTNSYTLVVTDFAVAAAGSLVTITFDATGIWDMGEPGQIDDFPLLERTRIKSGTVTVMDTQGFEPVVTVLEFTGCDAASLGIYGFRPRLTPLVASERSIVPYDDTYVVQTDTAALITAELARYANPIPVIALDRSSEDATYRADILARRVGHRVHLTLNGESQLGDDADFFVEAQEVRISPLGELRSTLWCVEAPPPPPPPPPPAQPTGFQIFRLDNQSLLLFWDNPNDAEITGYRIWRGTSGSNINTEIENSVGSATTTQYTDAGLTDGQEYWYQIQALYGAIASVRSDSASGIP